MKRSEMIDKIYDLVCVHECKDPYRILDMIEEAGMLPPPVTNIEVRSVWEDHNGFPGGGLMVDKNHEITRFEWESEDV